MPAYCTDGQVRRSFAALKTATVDFNAIAELRERVMGEVDAELAAAWDVPFNPWLRVKAVGTGTMTIGPADGAYLTQGDTVWFYDTSAVAMGATSGTIGVITANSDGTYTVAYTGMSGLAADDEIAVVTTSTAGAGSSKYAGPPRIVEWCAVNLARFYVATDIMAMANPPTHVVKGYDEAKDWMQRAALGTVEIVGASAVALGSATHEGYTRAIDVDAESEWEVDEDQAEDATDARD
jgi:hypothetical protein